MEMQGKKRKVTEEVSSLENIESEFKEGKKHLKTFVKAEKSLLQNTEDLKSAVEKFNSVRNNIWKNYDVENHLYKFKSIDFQCCYYIAYAHFKKECFYASITSIMKCFQKWIGTGEILEVPIDIFNNIKTLVLTQLTSKFSDENKLIFKSLIMALFSVIQCSKCHTRLQSTEKGSFMCCKCYETKNPSVELKKINLADYAFKRKSNVIPARFSLNKQELLIYM